MRTQQPCDPCPLVASECFHVLGVTRRNDAWDPAPFAVVVLGARKPTAENRGWLVGGGVVAVVEEPERAVDDLLVSVLD